MSCWAVIPFRRVPCQRERGHDGFHEHFFPSSVKCLVVGAGSPHEAEVAGFYDGEMWTDPIEFRYEDFVPKRYTEEERS